jgi:hypothetical protein
MQISAQRGDEQSHEGSTALRIQNQFFRFNKFLKYKCLT